MRIRVIQISTCSLASASSCFHTRSSSSKSLLGTLLKSSDKGRLMDAPGYLAGLKLRSWRLGKSCKIELDEICAFRVSSCSSFAISMPSSLRTGSESSVLHTY
ncbi:GM14936 [Drosophila sechellia]|uniref:GM14936 n=1 Tax=Drosophila sechellia TaxID=7238 RepID=B4IFS5_DROSE|nr:GM14936 [Drosophila sechellia]